MNVQEILSVLREEGFVHHADGQWNWTQRVVSGRRRQPAVGLVRQLRRRSTSRDGERVIGETDFTSGPSTLHEKAIYIVEGQLFQVERLDFDGRKAFVRQVECDYYTDAITYTKVTILETFATRSAEAGRETVRTSRGALRASRLASSASRRGRVRSHGEVHVVSRVVGFKKIKFYTNENVGSGELDLPEQQMHTTSYWLTIPAHVMAALPYRRRRPARRRRRPRVRDAQHRAAAADVRQARHRPVDRRRRRSSVVADGRHVGGGEPEALAAEPTIFIYDNYPGGIGFSEPLFEMHERAARAHARADRRAARASRAARHASVRRGTPVRWPRPWRPESSAALRGLMTATADLADPWRAVTRGE